MNLYRSEKMYHPGHTIHVTKTWRTWSKINVEEDSDGEPAMTEDTHTHTQRQLNLIVVNNTPSTSAGRF